MVDVLADTKQIYHIIIYIVLWYVMSYGLQWVLEELEIKTSGKSFFITAILLVVLIYFGYKRKVI